MSGEADAEGIGRGILIGGARVWQNCVVKSYLAEYAQSSFVAARCVLRVC